VPRCVNDDVALHCRKSCWEHAGSEAPGRSCRRARRATFQKGVDISSTCWAEAVPEWRLLSAAYVRCWCRAVQCSATVQGDACYIAPSASPLRMALLFDLLASKTLRTLKQLTSDTTSAACVTFTLTFNAEHLKHPPVLPLQYAAHAVLARTRVALLCSLKRQKPDVLAHTCDCEWGRAFGTFSVAHRRLF
jgi:hypothetical protein